MPTSLNPKLPLILDLDGTLTPADTTHELLVYTLIRNPLLIFKLVKIALNSKAKMKDTMQRLFPDAVVGDSLPLNSIVVNFAKAHKASGGQVYLCSGAHKDIVDSVVQNNSWLDGGWGSQEDLNLTSNRKAKFLEVKFPNGFSYVGNSTQDLAVWEKSVSGFAVNPPHAAKSVRTSSGQAITTLSKSGSKLLFAMRSMRVHQWVKNTLMLIVPLLVLGDLNSKDILFVFLGFIAFCSLASATYIINDIIDISSDRVHRTKRNRPLAAGNLSLPYSMVLVLYLLALSAFIGVTLPIAFQFILGLYGVVTLCYSFGIKKIAIADVVTLAGLFTIRVIAGANLVGAAVSPWLINFVAFFFLSLALAKRFTEIRKIDNKITNDPIIGRGYLKSDESLVMGIGVSMGAAAALSFNLYGILAPNKAIESGVGTTLLGAILVYWLMRVWLLAHRRELNDDPVVFAMKDRLSLVLATFCVVIILLGFVF